MTTLAEKREARNAIALPQTQSSDIATMVETVLIKGDLSKLTPQQRDAYYLKLCEVTGLNPLFQPFDYILFKGGKLALYAKKECAAQLRTIHNISVIDMDAEEREGVYTTTVKVQNDKGRMDMDVGSVSIAGLKGEDRGNAIKKSATQAKRRATLSICGLGLLDETEVETIPGALSPAPEAAGGEPDPQSPPRQQRPSSASAKRDGVWEQFTAKLAEFDDVDALERWWSHPRTQADVDGMPGTWPEQAHEEFEKRQEALLKAGAP